MKKQRKLSRQFIAAFTITFLISICICISLIESQSDLEQAQMGQIILEKRNKINESISELLYKTLGLSALVIQNNGSVENFERVAAMMVDDPAISNILLAPNGVVTEVYPVEGNTAVLGFDFFSPANGNQEAILARKTGELVLGGPFDLVQGGQALVGRIPVYLRHGQEAVFWGLVSVTLKYPQVLDRVGLEQLKQQGFAYEIWRVSPDTNAKQIIAHSDYAYNKSTLYLEMPMEFLNAKWYFRIFPIRAWYEYGTSWGYIFTGIFVSFLVAFLVQYNYELKHVKKELEDVVYIDLLTGILNRRGLFYHVHRDLLPLGEPYTLCYFDLDNFKEINDRYGHTAGDQALVCFAETVQSYVNGAHLFARIGGDEFILILSGQKSPVEISSLKQKIYAGLNRKPLSFQDKQIAISVSFGCAVFPRDGDTIDALISSADSQMYQEKIEKKKSQ